MSTLKYTGARYVLVFLDGWEPNTAYEPLMVVQRSGSTYISKQPVPAAIGEPENNPEYWILWADPNAQMEELRQLVMQYSEEVQDVEQQVGVVSEALSALAEDVSAKDNAIINLIKSYAVVETKEVESNGAIPAMSSMMLPLNIPDLSGKPGYQYAGIVEAFTEQLIIGGIVRMSNTKISVNVYNPSDAVVSTPSFILKLLYVRDDETIVI